ncbi:MAG: hypothetical protein ACFE9Q_16005 [Candidatus Hodarchaeota archaeon]
MEINDQCGICIVGIIFVLLEIFIVIVESFGWISYNIDFESFLFIIFLIFIVSYENKNHQDSNTNFKRKYVRKSQNDPN